MTPNLKRLTRSALKKAAAANSAQKVRLYIMLIEQLNSMSPAPAFC